MDASSVRDAEALCLGADCPNILRNSALVLVIVRLLGVGVSFDGL